MQIDSISPNLISNPFSIRSGEGASIPIPGGDQAGINGADKSGDAHSFGKLLENAIGEVNKAQITAGDMNTKFAAGAPLDVHQVMIAGQEAGIMLNMAMQVRNKLVEGYQEIMRVNV